MRSLLRPRKLRIRSPFKHISTSDRNVLLLCVTIAFFFWIVVKLSQPYQATKIVRMEYLLAPDKAMTSSPPETISMRLQATGWNLLFEFVSGRELQIEYDLREMEYFSLSASQLRNSVKRNLSSGDIEVVELNYEGMQFDLEQRAKRKLPIRLIDSITYARNFQLRTAPQLAPDSVVVTGPESMLAELTFWPTDSLAIQELDRNRKVVVNLQEPMEGMALIPAATTVSVEVEEFTQKDVWLSVEVRNPPADSIHIFPNKVQASVVVGLSDFDLVQADSFELVADLQSASLGEGKNTVPLELRQRPTFAHRIQLRQRSAVFYIVRPAADSALIDNSE